MADIGFVLHDFKAFYLIVAVDARNHNIGAGRLVQIDILAKTLGSTFFEGLALSKLIVTLNLVYLHLRKAHGNLTALTAIFALKI